MVNTENRKGATFIIFTAICTAYLVYIGKADIYFIILLFMAELFIKNSFDFILLLIALSKEKSKPTSVSTQNNQNFGQYQSEVKHKKTKYFDIQYSYNYTKIPTDLSKIPMNDSMKVLRIILAGFKILTQLILFFIIISILSIFAIGTKTTAPFTQIISLHNFTFLTILLLICATEFFSFLDKSKVKPFSWSEIPLLPPKEYVLIFVPLFVGLIIFSATNSSFYFIFPFLFIKLLFDLYMYRKSLK